MALYLVEKGRIPKQALELLLPALEDSSVLTIDNIDLDTVLAVQKIPRKDVPDMPDRLIAASAVHHDVPLITCDRKIRNSTVHTIW